ncbi:uncharacterized protein [Branchiostoma lanceolatum]|uniref:uncharacterized protein n=1 Tax=Branchiostoma lanceolatum TaxID=7740 RepID=UPI0034526623
MEQQCGDVMITPGTDIIQDHHLHPDRLYKDRLKEGDSSLARADLDSAEQHFAAALKTVHVRDPTAQQYQREVEPLCKLGDVYSKRGQQTGDGGDFVKAAALYNAAIARSEDQVLNGNLATAIKEVGGSFLKCVLEVNYQVSLDNTEKHKKQLKEMRDQIKLEMETIDQQLDPYVHDEDDPCVIEIEAKRAQAVRHLFENIAQQRKEFISLLVEECIGLMGPPPCKYALIGLGSQATGLVTPYSDLEFAILVEKESKECLGYFRNLTHYLHLKVVNLGETILPALGIKSLNDFYSGDDWFYDSVTTRGFAFDGSMPKASKTPLGRQGTLDKPLSELICTPENMVSKLQNDVTLHLKEGYHLATILRNPCLITGDQDLIDTYMDITGKILQAERGKLAQQLAQETMKEDMKTYSSEQTVTARLIDVKKEIYRFPAVAVDYLALFSHIMPTTVWKTIEEMKNQQVISPNNAHHLTVLTSISAELRLRTYIANGGQKENLSALGSMERALHRQKSSKKTNVELQTSALIPVFHLQNEQQLFRYYYTAVPLKIILKELSDKKSVLYPFPDFYEDSPMVRGVMYCGLYKYEQAISCYYEALTKADGTDNRYNMTLLNGISLAYHMAGDHGKSISYQEKALKMLRSVHSQDAAHPDIADSLNNLGAVWSELGDYTKAVSYLEQALQMHKSIYGQGTSNKNIASSLSHLGWAWHKLGDYRKAISYYEQALQMEQSIYGIAHHVIATSLNNLGLACSHLGNYREAISYYERSLQMHRSIYGQTSVQPDIAASINNLGGEWYELGDYRRAFSYYEQALQMYKRIYGQSAAHPVIAGALNNLGLACSKLGDYREAIKYCEQALQIYRNLYGKITPHPDTATSLNTLGGVWGHLGEHKRAISYMEQALQMYRSIYGQSTAHRYIATSLNNLGSEWTHLGEYSRAISYHEQALQMRRSIYGQSTTHPEIAISLINLGGAWSELSDFRRAISYYEQALQMGRILYGKSTPHPEITTSLKCLGAAWSDLGDYRKAISYYEQALQMCRSIHGQATEHPDIAKSLNRLGVAWHHLGKYRKAIGYQEQALQMQKSIYGQSTAHPDIATSLDYLGVSWRNMDDCGKAISYYEQALQMKKSIYGQSTPHPAIATLLINLGTAWCNAGDCRKAIRYHEQALQMLRCIHGKSKAHPHIVSSLNNLGTAWYHLDDHRTALSLWQEALAIARQIFPQDKSHPLIKGTERNIAQIISSCK